MVAWLVNDVWKCIYRGLTKQLWTTLLSTNISYDIYIYVYIRWRAMPLLLRYAVITSFKDWAIFFLCVWVVPCTTHTLLIGWRAGVGFISLSCHSTQYECWKHYRSSISATKTREIESLRAAVRRSNMAAAAAATHLAVHCVCVLQLISRGVKLQRKLR